MRLAIVSALLLSACANEPQTFYHPDRPMSASEVAAAVSVLAQPPPQPTYVPPPPLYIQPASDFNTPPGSDSNPIYVQPVGVVGW